MEFKVIHIDETDSTNRWLRAYMQAPRPLVPEGSYPESGEQAVVVVAEYQTAGKGCGENSWESERGKNLTFSVLLHPTEISANCQFRISEAVSVALCETIERLFRPLSPADGSPHLGERIMIKWPNDIYVGDRKICGILIENMLWGRIIDESIVGIGLNVNQKAFLSDAPNPVSIIQLTGKETDREALLQAFLKALSEAMAMEPEALAEAYRSRLYRKEGMYPFRDSKGAFEAKVLNVLDDGRLVLLDAEGKARIYSFKEVAFIIEN